MIPRAQGERLHQVAGQLVNAARRDADLDLPALVAEVEAVALEVRRHHRRGMISTAARQATNAAIDVSELGSGITVDPLALLQRLGGLSAALRLLDERDAGSPSRAA